MGAFAATKADPNPDPAKKSASESIKNSPLGAGPSFDLHMPAQTNANVLRAHGFDELADWAENPVLAPDYAQQSQYWSSVLLAPVYRDWAEWEPRHARDFQFDPEPDPELPEPDLPFLFPVFAAAAAVSRRNTTKIPPPPVPLEMPPRAEMRPNHPTTGDRSRVHLLLNGTWKCFPGVCFAIERVRSRLRASPSHSELRA